MEPLGAWPVLCPRQICLTEKKTQQIFCHVALLSGEPDYFGRNEISSGGDLSHYSSASLY